MFKSTHLWESAKRNNDGVVSRVSVPSIWRKTLADALALVLSETAISLHLLWNWILVSLDSTLIRDAEGKNV